MNREYFENIALKLDKVLEEEAERLKKAKTYESMEEKIEECFLNYYPVTVKDREEASLLMTKLADRFMELVDGNSDFNTSMLAFMSLYNFLKIKGIWELADRSILDSIGSVFKNKEEQEYFEEFVRALDAPGEEAFRKLQKINSSLEAAHMCLAVIYMQKILDYRSKEEEKNYNGLAYCLSKIDFDLRWAIFYDYMLKAPEPFDISKWKSIYHYHIYLPKIHICEERELAMAYESGSKKTAWPDYIAKIPDYKTLYLHQAVINDGKLYDVTAALVCVLGNYTSRLSHSYEELYDLQEERHNIIRDFSHTYENMQAAGLKEIADILMESTDSRVKQCGRVILAEYGMKDALKAEVNLLRLNFEDNQSDIAGLMRKGVCDHGNEDSADVNGIFEEALKICMLRVIYSGNPRGEDETAKLMYRRIKARAGSMKELVNRFEDEIILKNGSVRRFLESFGVPIKFDSDEEWNRLGFRKNKHAEVLLRSIFAELITNSLKYADLDYPVSYILRMKDGIFGIAQKNTVTETAETQSGVGLSSKGQILEKMNGYRSYYTRTSQEDEGYCEFEALFLIDKSLFGGEEHR